MRFPHSVVILRAALVAGYGGQQVRDWPNAVRTSSAANMQQQTAVEIIDNRQTTITSWDGYLPPDPVLLVTDRVEHDGKTLEVDGEVEDWTRGARGHIKARLKRVTDA